jgi:hypothetical protein
MAITNRHTYGWAKQTEFRPVIEQILQEPVAEVKGRYAKRDFKSPTWLIEFKSRPALTERGTEQDWDTYHSWLMPVCKISKLKADEHLIFFYHFEKSNTLWYIIYEPEVFTKYVRAKPPRSDQEHFYILRDDWIQVRPGDKLLLEADGIYHYSVNDTTAEA